MTRFGRAFVWLGGALFVLALADCFYAYSIPWGARASTAGIQPVLLDVGLFGVFAAHHSVFAREMVKRWIATVVPADLMRSCYVWIASALFLLVLALWRNVGGELYDVDGAGALALHVVQFLGLMVMARSVAAIDPLELAGIHQPGPNPRLLMTGPYRIVRHPLYLGWVLAVFGAAHMTGDRLTFAVVSSTYLVVAIPWEERSLQHAFGQPYADYMRRVRWRIMPFIY
jgi:protein-S-isoprenylcysteine O-methyltransferase Ste14